jgi:hypothetical protein
MRAATTSWSRERSYSSECLREVRAAPDTLGGPSHALGALTANIPQKGDAGGAEPLKIKTREGRRGENQSERSEVVAA